MKKIFFTLMILLVIFSLGLSACATPKVEEPAGEEPAAEEATTEETTAEETTAEEPAEPKVVTIAWTQEPDTLNMAYSNMWYSSGVIELFGCRPWQFDDNNEVYPSLLTAMPTVSDDGLVVTMNLRDDIFWSDGTPLTAEDFAFTHTMINSESNAVDSVYPYDLFEISSPDSQTVVMTFAEPFTPWMANLWAGDLMPKHILEPVYEAEGSIDEAEWLWNPTVGCGPFNFTEWESGSYLRFDRNENYWDPKAKLDTVFFQLVPDDAAQTAAALAGDVDIAFWPPYEDIPAFREAGLNIVTQASGYNEGWYFNLREDSASPGIRDLVVRQAIAMALDRESNTDIRLNVVSPGETFFDALPAFVSPDIEPWPFDPEAAKQMLTDAGYVDSDGDGIREDLEGNPLVITQGNTTKEERQNYQAVAQQQLLEVGIDLQIFSYDADILFGSYSDGGPAAIGDLDIMQWSDAPAFPDPDTAYWLCSELATDDYPWGYNYFICDEYLDGLFQEQVVTTDPVARQKIFHDITKYMHENVYFLNIWDDPDVWIVNPDLTGYKFSGVTCFYNINEWDFVE
jgi:peptide/nickel transport system substrate-binding protein